MGHATGDKLVYCHEALHLEGQAAECRLRAEDREVGLRLRLGPVGRGGPQNARSDEQRCGLP
eukprot:95539-Prymnesium_polylepis.1